MKRLVKVVAVCLSVLLVQSLGAAVLHVMLVEHTYCDSHQAFEHGDEAGDDEHHHQQHEQHADGGDDDHHAPDGEPAEEDCHWLSWLQGPSVPLPPMQASVLDLPPPADTTTDYPVTRRALIPHPIELLRLSPGHSPPVSA